MAHRCIWGFSCSVLVRCALFRMIRRSCGVAIFGFVFVFFADVVSWRLGHFLGVVLGVFLVIFAPILFPLCGIFQVFHLLLVFGIVGVSIVSISALSAMCFARARPVCFLDGMRFVAAPFVFRSCIWYFHMGRMSIFSDAPRSISVVLSSFLLALLRCNAHIFPCAISLRRSVFSTPPPPPCGVSVFSRLVSNLGVSVIAMWAPSFRLRCSLASCMMSV